MQKPDAFGCKLGDYTWSRSETSLRARGRRWSTGL